MTFQGAIVAKGRKRRAGVKRTASGRPSRAKDAYDEHRLGVETRMRRYRLSESEARDQKAGTVLGRMRLAGERAERERPVRELVAGELSEVEYQAGLLYLTVRAAYLRAVKAPGQPATGEAFAGDLASDSYAEWYQRAVKAYEGDEKNGVMGVLSAIERASALNRGRNLWAALDYLVVRDEDFVHMYDDLKIVLGALAAHFTLTESGRRAA